MKENELALPDEIVMSKIYLIRNQKVMLDKDLAALYQVETKKIKSAGKTEYKTIP